MLVGRCPTSLIKSWESSLFWRQYGVHGDFLEFLCCNWSSYRLETCVSGNLWSCPKEAKPIFLYDGERGIALKPMYRNSSFIWSKCKEIGRHFQMIWATPSYFTFLRWHQCTSILVRTTGDSLYFRQANQGSLPVLLGTRHCSAHNAGESGLISQWWGSFMVCLELRREPGVHSRVTAGVAINNFCFFTDHRTPL